MSMRMFWGGIRFRVGVGFRGGRVKPVHNYQKALALSENAAFSSTPLSFPYLLVVSSPPKP